MNFKTTCYGAVADPRSLGIHILAKVIPSMTGSTDVAFAWAWRAKDVCVYTQKEYDAETAMYVKTHGMKKNDGDTTWFYEFKKDGKKWKAILTTEIWFKPGAEHNVSPIAMLFSQFMGNGLHITKVKFVDAE